MEAGWKAPKNGLASMYVFVTFWLIGGLKINLPLKLFFYIYLLYGTYHQSWMQCMPMCHVHMPDPLQIQIKKARFPF